ncbi:DUF4115 domain-containing protein [Salipiger sp. 1_MG-2023]|uniref:helix-turn-helix domain-containing protein n=1 Tax=Salipiger sp. 1_MG-2023 TaxID=3062665 RepID=UPI0026E2733E|nr:helix-turn-helix domain-containing protein [Salipiger sp. 1_MG-2023]MDO6587873.1 DUF4115 domain-containing protein [Salipiger sp. 1_MG-2023]
MIGRKSSRKADGAAVVRPRGFDDYSLKLGDVMRGERATMGKSLLDVQRELRIKASYIAAIENCDPSAFDTPGFIAGYVRSYARYLGMDPDECFGQFCNESGFFVAHGMSEKASTIRKASVGSASVSDMPRPVARDPFRDPKMPFVPRGDSLLSRIEPGAVGSMLVLIALIGGIGYGGYAVLREVQRVQLAPVDQTPVVLSELDPLEAATRAGEAPEDEIAGIGAFTPPTAEAMDRLYRPQALDVPVLVARDAPISSLDPSTVGVFANRGSAPKSLASPDGSERLAQVSAPGEVTVVAVRPAWVRVRAADGSVLHEGVMNAGEIWTVPADQADAQLNAGESGAVYLAINGQTYGPVGPAGRTTRDLSLQPDVLAAVLSPADLSKDADLDRMLADRPQFASVQGVPGQPKVLEDGAPGVTMIAVRPAWVRVRAADGSVIYEAIMNAGDTFKLPATEEPATLRVGESGAVYFAVNGQTYGPAGSSGKVTKNLALSVDNLTKSYQVADIAQDSDLERVVAELNSAALTE